MSVPLVGASRVSAAGGASRTQALHLNLYIYIYISTALRKKEVQLIYLQAINLRLKKYLMGMRSISKACSWLFNSFKS